MQKRGKTEKVKYQKITLKWTTTIFSLLIHFLFLFCSINLKFRSSNKQKIISLFKSHYCLGIPIGTTNPSNYDPLSKMFALIAMTYVIVTSSQFSILPPWALLTLWFIQKYK